jgi:diguanylate cyclase (GGDEF)-like protein
VNWHKEQSLNDWLLMLHSVYGFSQNYARTQYEILAHLCEVTGAFGKFLFKLNRPDGSLEFLPKMFGWVIALAVKVDGPKANLEDIVLSKYPRVCSYCNKSPCECKPGEKKPIDESNVRAAFNRNAPLQRRSLNDFQMMFRAIYEHSWGINDVEAGTVGATSTLQKSYTRLVEELSELVESVRFVHLYPDNFDNELADYIAWLFALVSSMHIATPGREPFLVEDLFWPAYPGICTVCMLDVCDCRPRPVRELLSKPSLRALEWMDSLTQANNKARFDRDEADISKGQLPLPAPIACIRIDIDDFKRFNAAPLNHSVGDAALQHLATVMRQKMRNRDRLYRVGGDEFAALCPDFSIQEASGLMARVAAALKAKPVPIVDHGLAVPLIALSVGISECWDPVLIKESFEKADKLAIQSKEAGKDRITPAKE